MSQTCYIKLSENIYSYITFLSSAHETKKESKVKLSSTFASFRPGYAQANQETVWENRTSL